MIYTEKRLITAADLRRLCIKNDWYTLGDCDEYDNLFEHLGSFQNIGTAELTWLAKDIKDHSETDYEVTNIMFELHKISYIEIVEIEGLIK